MPARWMLIIHRCLASIVAIVTLIAPARTAAQHTSAGESSRPVGAWGVDLSDRDAAVKPGDDFYRSQNGAWLDRTELSATLSFAAYWADLRRLAPRRLNVVLAEVAANTGLSPQSIEGKAGAFFRSAMDVQRVETRGLAPLDAGLRAIRAAATPTQLAALMGHAAGPGTRQSLKFVGTTSAQAPFELSIAQDERDPARYTVVITEGGLGLPGPEYYADPQLADFKSGYRAYVAKMLGLLDWPDADARAGDIVDFETRIAAVSQGKARAYDRVTIAELGHLAPGLDWRAFLQGAGLGRVRSLVLATQGAMAPIARIVAETPPDVLRARQAFALIDDAAPTLNAAAVSAQFDFRYRTFNNKNAAPQPRQRLAFDAMDATVGSILGALYVKRYFSIGAKSAALEMFEHMRRALDTRLARAAWMSATAKSAARKKVAGMRANIGYPDKLPDYSALVIRDDDFYGNVARATTFDWERQVRRLNAAYDRSEWFFTPHSVNYAYTPTTNTVEMPSAALEPPFFDLRADAAVNYGAIGAMIGSQMIAGVDGSGRQYDATGRLRNWWTTGDSVAYDVMAKRMAGQYSAIEPLPGLHFKGDQLAREAMDDLGGLLIALDAYHMSLKGKPAPVLDGFTGDQRVFLGRAQMWRAKFPELFVRNQTAQARNALPSQRVNGPVRNIDAWYDAFDVHGGDRMYLAPGDRVRIW